MGRLVIKLKIGERCRIGDDIEILISDCMDGRADVAITAPKEQGIVRLPSLAKEYYGAPDGNSGGPGQRKSLS